MHALLLVAVLAAVQTSPPRGFGAAPIPVLAVTPTNKMVTSPMVQVPSLNRSFVSAQESSAAFDLTVLTDLVPYSAELNDWYQRYRADKRWEHGIGLTFTVSNQRHRWTLGLGPIQFVLAGRYGPVPR